MRLRQGGASAVKTLLLLVALFLVCFLSQAGAARADVLREIESLWSAALEEHGAILLIVRPDTGEIVRANAAAARFYGYSREQLESFVMQDLNLYSRERINQEREKAAQKGGCTILRCPSAWLMGGRSAWWACSLSPFLAMRAVLCSACSAMSRKNYSPAASWKKCRAP